MSRYFLVNRRRDPEGRYVPLEYDFAAETRVLPAESETEVSFAEAQVALCRYQSVGLSLKEIT